MYKCVILGVLGNIFVFSIYHDCLVLLLYTSFLKSYDKFQNSHVPKAMIFFGKIHKFIKQFCALFFFTLFFPQQNNRNLDLYCDHCIVKYNLRSHLYDMITLDKAYNYLVNFWVIIISLIKKRVILETVSVTI